VHDHNTISNGGVWNGGPEVVGRSIFTADSVSPIVKTSNGQSCIVNTDNSLHREYPS
jgi:hypothetical protein